MTRDMHATRRRHAAKLEIHMDTYDRDGSKLDIAADRLLGELFPERATDEAEFARQSQATLDAIFASRTGLTVADFAWQRSERDEQDAERFDGQS